jgi:hypothetical protein
MADTTNTPNTYASVAVVRVNLIKPDFKTGNMGGKYFSHVCYAIWNFEASEIVTALANHNRGTTYGYITEDGHLSRELTVDPDPAPEPELPSDADPETGVAYGDLT